MIEFTEEQQHLLIDDSDWTEDELRLQLARSAKDNGWEDAGMEAYDGCVTGFLRNATIFP